MTIKQLKKVHSVLSHIVVSEVRDAVWSTTRRQECLKLLARQAQHMHLMPEDLLNDDARDALAAAGSIVLREGVATTKCLTAEWMFVLAVHNTRDGFATAPRLRARKAA